MKKLLFLSLAILAVSCSPSPQEKAEALIKDAVQKSLYLPDTYQAVETKIDSAFTPYHDPEFVNICLDMCEKGYELDKLDSQINRAKSGMAIWSGPYMTSFSKEQYRQAKEEYEAAQEKYDALMAYVQKKSLVLKEKLEKEPEFIGFRAHHTYRANNNAGDTMLVQEYFLLDADITTIIAQWDSEEIELFEEFLNKVQEAAEMNQ